MFEVESAIDRGTWFVCDSGLELETLFGWADRRFNHCWACCSSERCAKRLQNSCLSCSTVEDRPVAMAVGVVFLRFNDGSRREGSKPQEEAAISNAEVGPSCGCRGLGVRCSSLVVINTNGER